jgi:hypothetical protein
MYDTFPFATKTETENRKNEPSTTASTNNILSPEKLIVDLSY